MSNAAVGIDCGPRAFRVVRSDLIGDRSRTPKSIGYRVRDLLATPWDWSEFRDNIRTPGRRYVHEVWYPGVDKWYAQKKQPGKSCSITLATYHAGTGTRTGRLNEFIGRPYGWRSSERDELYSQFIEYETKWKDELEEMGLVVRVTASGLRVVADD